MKEFCFRLELFHFEIVLKHSIDIFIMSVRQVFAEFQFIIVKRSCSRPRRQKTHHVCFPYFKKSQCFVDIVSARK